MFILKTLADLEGFLKAEAISVHVQSKFQRFHVSVYRGAIFTVMGHGDTLIHALTQALLEYEVYKARQNVSLREG